MGRLYDKLDLSWNLDWWNRQEQQMHADIANGVIEASFLDHWITERRNHSGPCERGCGCKAYKVRDGFELERKRERMKLLRTGSLLRELDTQRKLFRACSNCYVGVGTRGKSKGKSVDRPCEVHGPGLKAAKSAVYWAGEHNIAERNARGQRRAEGVVTAQEALEGIPRNSNELNKWEAWHLEDVKAGIWPQSASDYDTTPDYKGWLEMLLQNEEIDEPEYLAELKRLREENREQEETAHQWAGARIQQGARKGDRLRPERFRRDTRFNILTV